MTTTNITPTPISKRIAVIAEHLGWQDDSYYGDTDYGLGQEFTQDKVVISLSWGPDGRHGVSNELLSVTVVFSGLQKQVFYSEGRDQVTMRADAITALTEYALLP